MKLRRHVRLPYWRVEAPKEAICGGLLLRWFPATGRLQIHRLRGARPHYRATIEVDTLALSPQAQELLGGVLEQAARLKLWA